MLPKPEKPGKPEKPENPPAKACKWTLKKSYYAVAGHADQCPRKGTPAQLADLFDDLEDAKAACLKAGDCAAVCKQNRGDICHNKWRVVHAEDPEWKTYPNGFKAVSMHGYAAAPECLSKAPNLPHPSLTHSINQFFHESSQRIHLHAHAHQRAHIIRHPALTLILTLCYWR